MRLVDIKGDAALELIAEVFEPVCNIASDKEFAKLVKVEKLPEGEDPIAFSLKRIKSSVPVLIRTHKADLVHILAAVNGVSEKEYLENVNPIKLIADAVLLFNTDGIGELFMSAQTGTARE